MIMVLQELPVWMSTEYSTKDKLTMAIIDSWDAEMVSSIKIKEEIDVQMYSL